MVSRLSWREMPKKEPPFPAAFEVDNREASNRVDRSHSVSKQGQSSHNRESLIDRKRTIFFRVPLPCRPLAEWRATTRSDTASTGRPRARGDPYSAAVLMREG